MSKLRQGDVLLFSTGDGGNIEIINGEPTMDGGFESAVYMSLFQSDGKPHWMEEYQEENEKTRSEFHNFIKGNLKTVGNLNRAVVLAEKDLDWFITSGIADTPKNPRDAQRFWGQNAPPDCHYSRRSYYSGISRR